ncbi:MULTISPECIES: DUF309 domain-containing protein [unclassified Leptolyngbya]|uniref:DUF309 domain-containing protein n=1 Tax=unclassified Leptolyngbya TaxID=2650499 RepID=UPI001686B0EA|nr:MULTISPECIES: DUF309 domain-containing protein [unclassified Leptolyngbya]MBD1911592.1 DUF309 domain-containing protein [Leptolyngbya sp. FACHB-8]MBD2158775.1 DUF309 domain-containing protein [Leptolyngbya sp. FACHB-16]
MDDPIPVEFWQGIDEFNQGEYYACHDTLEAIWMEASEPHRTFYQGILQMAVALYHLGNGNGRGAAILLGEGMKRLRPYQPDYADVDVESLLETGYGLLVVLQSLPPESLPEFWQSLLAGKHSEVSLPRVTRAAQGDTSPALEH